MIVAIMAVFHAFAVLFGFTCAHASDDRQSLFYSERDHSLENSLLSSLFVGSAMECAIKCTQNNLCKSLNYQHSKSNDVSECHLSNKAKRTAPAEDFIENAGFTYYEKNPCFPSPCVFGTCLQDSNNAGFLCSCKPERIGWTSQKPGKSCLDILSSGDAVHDGKYWINPDNSGNAMQVYCEMSHEGGGWLLVSNVVVPDPTSVPTLNLITSYRDIANYIDNTTIISATALGQLCHFINFTQLRFQCHQTSINRTIHVITAANSTGYDVVNYFTATNNTRPQACNSFYRGTGDSSLVAGKCSEWGWHGKWGSDSRINEWRIHDHAFYVPFQNHWTTKTSNLQCDSNQNVQQVPGDYWKIYVR